MNDESRKHVYLRAALNSPLGVPRALGGEGFARLEETGPGSVSVQQLLPKLECTTMVIANSHCQQNKLSKYGRNSALHAPERVCEVVGDVTRDARRAERVVEVRRIQLVLGFPQVA